MKFERGQDPMVVMGIGERAVIKKAVDKTVKSYHFNLLNAGLRENARTELSSHLQKRCDIIMLKCDDNSNGDPIWTMRFAILMNRAPKSEWYTIDIVLE